MINRSKLKQFFGVGPIGALFTIAMWAISLVLEKVLNISQIQIHPILRTAFITVFTIDALYLLVGSNYQIRKHGKGDVLMTKGPYQFIRHPIYSAWVYSFTCILSMMLFSWAIIFSVIPINLFWSWLVTYEENKMLNKFGNIYKDYMNRTGQFLPSWKDMKESLGENPD